MPRKKSKIPPLPLAPASSGTSSDDDYQPAESTPKQKTPKKRKRTSSPEKSEKKSSPRKPKRQKTVAQPETKIHPFFAKIKKQSETEKSNEVVIIEEDANAAFQIEQQQQVALGVGDEAGSRSESSAPASPAPSDDSTASSASEAKAASELDKIMTTHDFFLTPQQRKLKREQLNHMKLREELQRIKDTENELLVSGRCDAASHPLWNPERYKTSAARQQQAMDSMEAVAKWGHGTCFHVQQLEQVEASEDLAAELSTIEETEAEDGDNDNDQELENLVNEIIHENPAGKGTIMPLLQLSPKKISSTQESQLVEQPEVDPKKLFSSDGKALAEYRERMAPQITDLLEEIKKLDPTADESEQAEVSESAWNTAYWSDIFASLLDKRLKKQNEADLFYHKYAPASPKEVVDNKEVVDKVCKFLNKWKKPKETKKAKKQEKKKPKRMAFSKKMLNDDYTDDEEEVAEKELQESNVIILRGDVAAGKTATVYACANTIGYQVIELNPADDRSAGNISSTIKTASTNNILENYNTKASKEAIVIDEDDDASAAAAAKKTHPLFTKATAKAAESKQPATNNLSNLIFFDEIDFELTERTCFAAIKSFISTTKRPVILSCNSTKFIQDTELASVILDSYIMQMSRINTNASDSTSLEDFNLVKLFGNKLALIPLIALCEGMKLSLQDVITLMNYYRADIRKILLQLEFHLRSKRLPPASLRGPVDFLPECKSISTLHLLPSLLNISNLCNLFIRPESALEKEELDSNWKVLEDQMKFCQEERYDISFQNYLQLVKDTRHDTKQQQYEELSRISTFADALSDLDMSHISTAGSKYHDDILDRQQQLNAQTELQHYVNFVMESKAPNSCVEEEMASSMTRTLPIATGVNISNHLYDKLKSSDRKVVDTILRKGISPVSYLRKDRFAVAETLATICKLEQQRKEMENKRRFAHALDHMLDQEDIDTMLIYSQRY